MNELAAYTDEALKEELERRELARKVAQEEWKSRAVLVLCPACLSTRPDGSLCSAPSLCDVCDETGTIVAYRVVE